MLRERAEVVVGDEPGSGALGETLPGAHAILLRTARMTAEDIGRAPNLKVIARHGVGVDNVEVEAASRRNVPVLITPRANLRSVAEHVFALALAVNRRLLASDRAVREARFTDRERLVGRELFGTTIGVIGLGRIGAEVARLAADGFGMRVLGYDPQLSPEQISGRNAEPVETLAGVLGASDLVTVHVPLTGETRGLIGSEELASMRPGAVLIQASRGGVVDENALADSLRSGRLAGAGIDVYASEPPPEDHPFLGLDNVVLTPHTAALTEQAMRRMALDAAGGIIDVLGGADPSDPPEGAGWQAVDATFPGS